MIQQLPGVTLMARGASGGMNAYSKILLNGSDRYLVIIDGVRSNWNGSTAGGNAGKCRGFAVSSRKRLR